MKIISLILGFALGIVGVFASGYILIFWGIVEPIMDICKAIDTHTATTSLIGWLVVKFFIRELLAAVVGITACLVAGLLIEFGMTKA